jgi:hypothetical protein
LLDGIHGRGVGEWLGDRDPLLEPFERAGGIAEREQRLAGRLVHLGQVAAGDGVGRVFGGEREERVGRAAELVDRSLPNAHPGERESEICRDDREVTAGLNVDRIVLE